LIIASTDFLPRLVMKFNYEYLISEIYLIFLFFSAL